MKTFAPVLALAGLAAATENNIFKRDAQCDSQGDAVTGEECADAINYLLENKDIPQIFPPVDEGSCPTVRCSAPCSIKVCPETTGTETTFDTADILLDVREILKTCGGDGNTPFHGEVASGEGDSARTVKLERVEKC